MSTFLEEPVIKTSRQKTFSCILFVGVSRLENVLVMLLPIGNTVQKLVVTGATLVVTSALLVVTRSY